MVADSPGFLVNRILFPYLDEAVRLVIEGVWGKSVDEVAKRFGMPVGPLELLDQIGIDIAADVAKTFAALTRDPGPVPARFAEMVKDGALGRRRAAGSTNTRKANEASRPVRSIPAQPMSLRVEVEPVAR